MVAAALTQQIVLRAVQNTEFRLSILSKWFSASFVISEVESYAVKIKLYFKSCNSCLFSMIVSWKSFGVPLNS